MANKHNPDIPAIANQLVEDINDIRENQGFLKEVFQSYLNKWSDTDASELYPVIMSDDDLDTLIQLEESADEDIIRFDTGAAGEQFIITDGEILPTTDDDIDLGAAALEFKNIYIDGVAYLDSVEADAYAMDSSNNAVMPTNGVAAHAKFMVGEASTIMWMYNNTAEPGWKVLTTGEDTVLAVAGGAQDYNDDGGTQGGTWTISGVTGAAHTHSGLTVEGVAIGDQDAWFRTNTVTGPQNTSSVNSTGAWRASGSIGKLFQLDTA